MYSLLCNQHKSNQHCLTLANCLLLLLLLFGSLVWGVVSEPLSLLLQPNKYHQHCLGLACTWTAGGT